MLLAAALTGTALPAVAGGTQAYAGPVVRAAAPLAAPPSVTTSDLQDSESGAFNDAIGRPVTFAFAPNGVTGVTRYQYAWNDATAAGASGAASVPAGPDGTATVTLTVPFTQDFVYRLYVVDFDQANDRSAEPGVFEFYLSSPHGPVGHWSLDEASGPSLADSAGGHTATAHGGTFGRPGRVGSAITFDGTADYAETSGPVVDAGRDFTAAAWVQLDRATGSSTAVSEDGSSGSVFALRYAHDADRWSLSMCGTRVISSHAPTLHRWTHLAGVYDAAARRAQLYVDGALEGTADCASAPDPGVAGDLAIGRAQSAGTKTDFFAGSIDDVRVYDRVVFATEPDGVEGTTGGIADLANRPVIQEAHWTGDAGSGTTVADSSGRGHDATLSAPTAWTSDGQVDGALDLNDATKDHAQTAAPVVRTDGSFTVTAWVRLAKSPTADATALSQDGRCRSGFTLGYRVIDGIGRWSFALPAADRATASLTEVLDSTTVSLDGSWHHLAGVYDAAARKIRLYVDGDLRGQASFTTPWNATGPFQLGQARARAAATAFWPGGIDDAQAFTGVLTSDEISTMAS